MTSAPLGLGVVMFDKAGLPQTDSSSRLLKSLQRSPTPQSQIPAGSSACMHEGTRSVAGASVPDTARTSHEQHDAADNATSRESTLSSSTTRSCSVLLANDSGFSRHDSLFTFGVSPSRNAAELKSLLGNSHSRLKPGATVLPLHLPSQDPKSGHAVSLEQAKPRARVEADIVLESDCCMEGGYMRGHVKLRVRRRQKNEPFVLLAEGKVRVIGFESIPGERDHYTFYQRASPLSAITDAYTGVYESSPDTEGFSRAVEGVHVLPFAMHLAIDDSSGSAKGVACLPSGVKIRYIAMVSVKVKDSKTGKRSIAHFYRDCQVWPRLNPKIVLATAPRPIQASTAKSLAVIGGGSKLKLTAMLHRMTWISGQRCFVRIYIENNSKKAVKAVTLTLVRTITLFKPQPQLDPGNILSVDPDACQTVTVHKVVAETSLERSHAITKGHASAEGWWTGVPAGQEAQFSHWILLPSEALSLSRSRLVEVEYIIRVTASAGALTPDVHVTLPVRIINFLSVDPTPSEPLLSPDGAYTRLIPYESTAHAQDIETLLRSDTAASTVDERGIRKHRMSSRPSSYPFSPHTTAPCIGGSQPSIRCSQRISLDTPVCSDTPEAVPHALYHKGEHMMPVVEDGRVPTNATEASNELDTRLPSTSSCSVNSSASSMERLAVGKGSSGRDLGNLDLEDGAGSDDEVDFVIGTAQLDSGSSSGSPDGHCGDVGDDVPCSNVEGHHLDIDNSEACAGDTTDPETSCGLGDRSSQGRPQAAKRRRSRLSAATLGIPHGVHLATPHSDRSREKTYVRARTGQPYAMSEEPPSRSTRERLAPRHTREAAACSDEAPCGDNEPADDEDESAAATPRLGLSAPTNAQLDSALPDARSSAGSCGVSDSDSLAGSLSRQSRQLPQPPSGGASQMCEIPASFTALESLSRSGSVSRLAAPDVENNSKTSRKGDLRTDSTLSRSTAHRSLPSTPFRSTTSVSSNCHDERAQPAQRLKAPPTLTSPTTQAALHQYPTHASQDSGLSGHSLVKGRIAAFEERLRQAQAIGAV
ncbi:hypothetical protein C8Q80DRAFT_1130287 [Daedaleopsis nitida]|nr:hypothetical protein C8Q80DRAFT_1130287 [Daedaleopsis nitida]